MKRKTTIIAVTGALALTAVGGAAVALPRITDSAVGSAQESGPNGSYPGQEDGTYQDRGPGRGESSGPDDCAEGSDRGQPGEQSEQAPASGSADGPASLPSIVPSVAT